jgi:hypothetical protein
LAAIGVDEQLLLAIDDRHVAIGIDTGDVTGVRPAILVNCLGRPIRIAAVAAHHVRTAEQKLSVAGQLHLAAWDRTTDGARTDGARPANVSVPEISASTTTSCSRT